MSHEALKEVEALKGVLSSLSGLHGLTLHSRTRILRFALSHFDMLPEMREHLCARPECEARATLEGEPAKNPNAHERLTASIGNRVREDLTEAQQRIADLERELAVSVHRDPLTEAITLRDQAQRDAEADNAEAIRARSERDEARDLLAHVRIALLKHPEAAEAAELISDPVLLPSAVESVVEECRQLVERIAELEARIARLELEQRADERYKEAYEQLVLVGQFAEELGWYGARDKASIPTFFREFVSGLNRERDEARERLHLVEDVAVAAAWFCAAPHGDDTEELGKLASAVGRAGYTLPEPTQPETLPAPPEPEPEAAPELPAEQPKMPAKRGGLTADEAMEAMRAGWVVRDKGGDEWRIHAATGLQILEEDGRWRSYHFAAVSKLFAPYSIERRADV